jgi:LPXTG-motif cell wall-anchored protein
MRLLGWLAVLALLVLPAAAASQTPQPPGQAPQPAPAEPEPAPPEPDAEPAPPEPAPAEPAPEPPPAEELPAEEEQPRAEVAADRTVTIGDFRFGPGSVTVDVGDTVTWTNRGKTEHTATGDGFDTGTLAQGQSGSHTFGSAGSFAYICTPHPFMEGTVRVVAASGGGGGDGGDGGGSAQPAPAEPDGAAEAPAAAAQDTTAGGSELANTGADSPALAVLGALLLAAGVAVRRRLSRPA